MNSRKSKVDLKKQWDDLNDQSFAVGLKLFDIDEGSLRKYHIGKTLAFSLSYGATLEKAISMAFKPKKYNNFDMQNLRNKMNQNEGMLNRYDRLLALALSGNVEATLLELDILNEENLKRRLSEIYTLHQNIRRDGYWADQVNTCKSKSSKISLIRMSFNSIYEDLKTLFK